MQFIRRYDIFKGRLLLGQDPGNKFLRNKPGHEVYFCVHVSNIFP